MFERQVLSIEQEGTVWFITLSCAHRVWVPMEVKVKRWLCMYCGLSWLEGQKTNARGAGAATYTVLKASGESPEGNIWRPETYRYTNQVVCWEWDCTTDQVVWRSTTGPLLGSGEALAGTGPECWLQRVHPNDHERVMGGVYAALDGPGRHWSDKYLFQRGDGSYVEVLDEAEIIRNPRGFATQMIGQMFELTAVHRKQ